MPPSSPMLMPRALLIGTTIYVASRNHTHSLHLLIPEPIGLCYRINLGNADLILDFTLTWEVHKKNLIVLLSQATLVVIEMTLFSPV